MLQQPFPFLHQVIGPVSEFRADMASRPVIFQFCKADCFTVGFTYYPSSLFLGSMSSKLHRGKTMHNNTLVMAGIRAQTEIARAINTSRDARKRCQCRPASSRIRLKHKRRTKAIDTVYYEIYSKPHS